jgi:hypothetical protein
VREMQRLSRDKEEREAAIIEKKETERRRYVYYIYTYIQNTIEHTIYIYSASTQIVRVR